MLAFAANSIICRAAFNHSTIDAANFTSIRLISGALMLFLLARSRHKPHTAKGNWMSAFILFVYAAGFSFAYVKLSAATGALLLFGAVQATMIGYGVWRGERLNKLQVTGVAVAFCGLIILLLPGFSSPPLFGAVMMVFAGSAWGVYSLRAKDMGDPIWVTAGNFSRSIPFSVILSLIMIKSSSLDNAGLWYAATSGALTSGVGYVIWYAALPALKATTAATVQLSVPVLTALGGVVFLSETVTLRLAVASITILGGIALVILDKNIIKT
jgi:drug/metabolite transporter (DMT)-like permease